MSRRFRVRIRRWSNASTRRAREVSDPRVLDSPGDGGRCLRHAKGDQRQDVRELADLPFARGVYLRRITRNLVEIPILPETEVLRGDILTIAGSTRHVEAAVEALGYADRPVEATDLMTVAGGIVLGGAHWRAQRELGRRFRSSLSTSGGALLAGLVLGYLRAVRPTFGRIPAPALALMNTLGLNVFIAIVGINAGPGFVAGLQQVGLSLFVWGIVATSVPLITAVLLGHYVFKFHPAILFGVCAGVRTTTAALGMIQDAAKSKVPALGYGMPYAIGNTLLTIFGMAVVLLMQPVRARRARTNRRRHGCRDAASATRRSVLSKSRTTWPRSPRRPPRPRRSPI